MLLVGGYAWDPRLLLPGAKNPASFSWYNSFPPPLLLPFLTQVLGLSVTIPGPGYSFQNG